jgi:hypothetical protein
MPIPQRVYRQRPGIESEDRGVAGRCDKSNRANILQTVHYLFSIVSTMAIEA